jgi:pre-mRNA-splicing factor ATP-dependent RNA helicase DHX16
VKTLKKARDIREQLEGLCERVEIELVSNPLDPDAISKAITAGFFYHTAKFQKDGNYRTIKYQHSVSVHPQSCLFNEEVPPRWVLYHELVETTKEFMRNLIVIKPEWLIEIAPHYYKPKDVEDPSKMKMPKAPPQRR